MVEDPLGLTGKSVEISSMGESIKSGRVKFKRRDVEEVFKEARLKRKQDRWNMVE